VSFDATPMPELGPDRWSWLDPAPTSTDFLRTELQSQATPAIRPAETAERSANALRPTTFDGIIGQEKVKRLLKRMTSVAIQRGIPLDHVLLVGPSGTGKTTFAHVIAHAMGTRVFQLEAPVSHDSLVELARTMQEGDILFLDEVHQQAVMERRGKSSATQPEVLFGVMEDRTLATAQGILPFPHITVMGATTDEGMLPDPFINRFPIRPRLERYSDADMYRIVLANAEALGLGIERQAAMQFARACRGVPREANNYVKNAAMLTDFRVTPGLASEVLHELNGVTDDGLTADMQNMLTFLLTRARHTRGDGAVKYQASVSTIATAIGKSRDQKAIALRVEPYLIEKGYVQVGHGGRSLTPVGIERARQLLED
jgi:holliday junction DNA helicase RuvB